MDPELPVRRTLAIGSTAVFGAAIAFTIPLEATVQQRIEDGVREPVGIYLGQAVPRGTPVGLESAGYFGYYSRSTIWDYPGLTSATGLDAIRHLPPTGRSVATMLAELHPPWIVVRPSEWADLQRADPILASRYELCRSFDSGTGDRLTVVGMELRTVDDHFDVRALDGCPQSTD